MVNRPSTSRKALFLTIAFVLVLAIAGCNRGKVITVTEPANFETIREDDSSILAGLEKESKKGVKGKKEVKYRVVKKGKKTKRTRISERITKKPVARVVRLGTKPWKAKDYIERFKEKDLKLGAVVYYTAKDDPNELLGKTGQYIEKASWEDTEDTWKNPGEPDGGTIEIFDDKKNMARHKRFLTLFIKGKGPYREFLFENNFALIRLSKGIDRKHAKRYFDALPPVAEKKKAKKK